MKTSFPKHNRVSRRFGGIVVVLAIALKSCVPTQIRAQVVVVPNAFAMTDGDTSIDVPESDAALRLMLIADASQFRNLSGPSLLTQFSFRSDTSSDSTGPRAVTLRIHASTTKWTVDSMSTTFSENIGPNNTLVFDGTLTLTTKNLPGPGNTRQFDLVTPFTIPFLYDPGAGNLLLDFQVSSDNGLAISYDAVSNDPAIRVLGNFESPTAPTGSFAIPQVTQFTFETQPSVTLRTSQVEVCWNSRSNITYEVQYRSGLTTNLWTPLVGCLRSTNSTTCIQDPVVAGEPQRFYRVVQVNCVP